MEPNLLRSNATRRVALFTGAGVAAAAVLTRRARATEMGPSAAGAAVKECSSDTITVKDGTRIYFKDWGPRNGQPVVFSHGWPLSADAWEDQMIFLGGRGFRCIAHDRRGHGRSSQPWAGNDMDTYA